MKTALLLLLACSTGLAAEFPSREYRSMEMRAKALLIGSDLSKAGGKNELFDPAKALQACDQIDQDRTAQFKEMQARRTQAAKTNAGWEETLKSQWGWDKKLTLNEAIAAQEKDWTELSEVALPCKDPDSLTLVNNVVSDFNAADDAPFSLCVRMVKALRNSGVCGRPAMPTIAP
jgi:hypothetical protein